MVNTNRKSTTVFGIAISYVDSGGDGLPLVLLHGSGSSKSIFKVLHTDPLLAKYRIVSIDLPGHGHSENANVMSTYTFSGLAKIVESFLRSIGVQVPVVLGWSLGGHVAIELAASGFPLAGLFLTGTPPLARGPFGFLSAFQPKFDVLLATKPVFSQADAQRFAELIYGPVIDKQKVDDVARADGNCRGYVAKSIFRAEGRDQRRFLAKTDLPVAIVNGSNDPLLRMKYFNHIHAPNLWRSKCIEIEGAGHSCFVEAADTFNALLAEFLDDIAVSNKSRAETHSTSIRQAVN